MKRILVPTDFSPKAENALKVAADVAKRFGYEIYVLHMLEMPLHLLTDNFVNDNQNPPEAVLFMKMAHKRFKKLLDKAYLKDIHVQETVEFTNAFEGIIDNVDKYNIDMIIMGSNGASGMEAVFVGSNTEKVVRYSEVPVLVIKEDIPGFKIHDFIFATDFTPQGRDAFLRAYTFAKTIKARFHLVYINTINTFKTSTEIEEKMKKFLGELERDQENLTLTVFNDKTIEEGVLNFARQTNAQLMGIATHGRKGLAHLLNGSISEDLVNHAKKPVITFKI